MQIKAPYRMMARAFRCTSDGKTCSDEEARMLVPVGVEGGPFLSCQQSECKIVLTYFLAGVLEADAARLWNTRLHIKSSKEK